MKIFSSCLILLCALSSTVHAATLGELQLCDRVGHNWANELVSLSTGTLAQSAARPDAMQIVDNAGKGYPLQLTDVQTYADGSLQHARAWADVDLKADSALTLQLQNGAVAPVAKPATATIAGDVLTLDNGTGETALRMPASVDLAQAKPLRDCPAPFQSLRMANRQWAGKGSFVGDTPIHSIKSEILSNGPLFAEAKITYLGDGDTHYTVTAKVMQNRPVVMVEEEFNLPAPQDGPESDVQTDPTNGGTLPSVNFSFNDGLAPDAFRFKGRDGSRGFTAIHPGTPYEEGAYDLKLGTAQRNFSIMGFMSWWPSLGQYVELYNKAGGANSPVVGIFKTDSSHWFNPTGIQLWTDPKLGVYVSAPLGITHRRSWNVDGVHDSELNSEIFSGTFDPGLPPNLGRRAWAFYTVPKSVAITEDYTPGAKTPINLQMISLGELPLEKVKDWKLDWDNKATQYPRLVTKPEEYAATIQRIESAPPGAYGLCAPDPSKLIAKPGTPEENTKAVANLADSVMGFSRELLEVGGATGMATHFFNLGLFMEAQVPAADRLLANPGVSEEQKQRLQEGLAFLAYVESDHSYYPIGSGFHLGNPNMPMIVDAGLGDIGCLYPTHPDSGKWLERGFSRGVDRFTHLVDPETGAWEECPHYMVDATFRPVFPMFFAMRNNNYYDFFTMPQVKKVLQYNMGIMSPPDPRFGIRMLAPIGDSGLRTSEWFGWAAAAWRNLDPDMSAQMQWMWNNSGKNIAQPATIMVVRPDLPEKAPVMKSTWYKGFGAVLRNGVTDPNETWMVYRQGMKISHYDEGDQGEWHLFAKGAPLSVSFGSQYNPRIAQPWLRNRISIDHQADPFIGTQHDIQEFVPSPSADFVSGKSIINQIAPMDELPYVKGEQGMDATGLKSIPTTIWRRSMLFVKDRDLMGPNYFVVRDTFEGATKPTDWSCWSLSSSVNFTGNVASFTGQLGVDLDVAMISPEKVTFVQNNDPVPPPPTIMPDLSSKKEADWPAEYQHPAEAHPPIMAHNFMHGNTRIYWDHLHPGVPFEERQICARVNAGPGQGYFAVLYPRLHGTEEIPTYAAWEGGQGVELTFKNGHQYVLDVPQQVVLKVDKVNRVDADASTAIVRDRGGIVQLDLVRGNRLAYGGYAIAGSGPVTLHSSIDSLNGTISGAARKITITLPAALARGKSLYVDGTKVGDIPAPRFDIFVEVGEHTFNVK